MTKLALLAATAAALAIAAPAGAVTVSFGDLYSSTGALAAGEVMLNDFAAPSASVTGTGGWGYFTGLTEGIAAPPAGNTSQYLAVLGGGAVTIDFGVAASAFSIDLGSLDGYNNLQILFQAAGSGDWWGSEMGTGLYNGDQFAQNSNRRFTFTAQGAEKFTGIKLVSDQNSFEVDNLAITAAVPEPATWAMLLTGFGLVGAAARRRRQAGFVTVCC